MFPDVQIFILLENSGDYVFGKYYNSMDQLRNSQKSVKGSVLEHIKEESSKNESMKISKTDLCESFGINE